MSEPANDNGPPREESNPSWLAEHRIVLGALGGGLTVFLLLGSLRALGWIR